MASRYFQPRVNEYRVREDELALREQIEEEDFKEFVIDYMLQYGGCVPEIMPLLEAHRHHFGRPITKLRYRVMCKNIFKIITKRVEPCGDIYFDLKPQFMPDTRFGPGTGRSSMSYIHPDLTSDSAYHQALSDFDSETELDFETAMMSTDGGMGSRSMDFWME